MQAMRRHFRFLLAFGLGAAIWGIAATLHGDQIVRGLMAVNGFFVTYLALMLHLMLTTTADDLRRHAEADDEGSALIMLVAIGAVLVSLTSIFLVLNRPDGDLPTTGFALISAPLGWLLIHTLMTFRYAHLYYSADPDDGLDFPNDSAPEPGVVEFVYVAFTIGMTAQVSDTEVTTTPMRRVVILHGIGSFFYNTVILALTVNAGIQMTS